VYTHFSPSGIDAHNAEAAPRSSRGGGAKGAEVQAHEIGQYQGAEGSRKVRSRLPRCQRRPVRPEDRRSVTEAAPNGVSFGARFVEAFWAVEGWYLLNPRPFGPAPPGGAARWP